MLISYSLAISLLDQKYTINLLSHLCTEKYAEMFKAAVNVTEKNRNRKKMETIPFSTYSHV